MANMASSIDVHNISMLSAFLVKPMNFGKPLTATTTTTIHDLSILDGHENDIQC